MKKKVLKKNQLVKVYIYTLDTEAVGAWGGVGYLPKDSELIDEKKEFWE